MLWSKGGDRKEGTVCASGSSPRLPRDGSGQISSHRLLLSQKALHLPKLILTKAFGGAPRHLYWASWALLELYLMPSC